MSSDAVLRYHDGSKHHFQRFARSLGYLDWASQPAPFRSFAGAFVRPLYPAPGWGEGGDVLPLRYRPRITSYNDLFGVNGPAEPVSRASVGDLFRHSLGLSAWKSFRGSRWSLRVNPSSGNLHPTEAYLVCGPSAGVGPSACVFHYAADRHALEQRCAFDAAAWSEFCDPRPDVLLVVLTSIHWREAWKYGERAFRYCQHDLGHAIGAVSLAASMLGWRSSLLRVPHAAVASIAGVDRAADFVEAEPEEPSCILAVGSELPPSLDSRVNELAAAVRGGAWEGRASQLSEDHVQWSFIDQIAEATRDQAPSRRLAPPRGLQARWPPAATAPAGLPARRVMLKRRSAVAFDGVGSVSRDVFMAMLLRTMPAAAPPWDALWWPPRVHLLLFVHRVAGLDAGLYVVARRADAVDALRAVITREFEWRQLDEGLPLFRLASGDCRSLARRLSCDQDIAADGYFSLGMLAELDAALASDGAPAYRHLFWECGVIGQVLYLEAEAWGARATGIGCFYDDPVHEVLGLTSGAQGRPLQSLYHFTVGAPVEDARLASEPGYEWETEGRFRA